MTFREIAFGKPEYRQECLLRDEVLRRPLGLSLGGEDLTDEESQLHFGLFAPGDDLLALNEALTRLAAVDPRKAELVQLRYFAGLTLDEAARVLGISPATADRDWAYARAWLHQAIQGGGKK